MSVKNSIILCTYNEVNYIEKAILEMEKNVSNLELVIVDDFSTDGTVEILKKINQNNKYKIIYRQKSRGLASAFMRGIIETSGENIGWIDTNMSEEAPRFKDMEKELNDNNDLVILSRYIKGGGDNRAFLRVFCSRYFNLFCRALLGFSINDYTSSIFLMKRKILNEVTLLCYGHGEFFIEFLYKVNKKGFKIKEIPYVQKKDKDEKNSKSSPNLIRYFYLGLLYVLRVFTSLIRRD